MSEAHQHEHGPGTTSPIGEHKHIHNHQCYCSGVGPMFSRFARVFGPPESATQHFRQARIEILRGFRAIIDERIERLSRRDRKGSRVVVE